MFHPISARDNITPICEGFIYDMETDVYRNVPAFPGKLLILNEIV